MVEKRYAIHAAFVLALPIVVALCVIGLIAAFWFANLASHLRRDEIERMRIEFARERERLKVQAERDKTKLIQKNQKTIVTETRRAETRANRKVGLAVAAAAGVGLVMLAALSRAGFEAERLDAVIDAVDVARDPPQTIGPLPICSPSAAGASAGARSAARRQA